jgi:hypothetical protein
MKPWTLPKFSVAWTFFLLTASAFAQTDCGAPSFVISVLNRTPAAGGRFSLIPSNLHVKVGGRDTSVESVSAPSSTLRIAVLIDIGSRQDKATWEAANQLLHDFLAAVLGGTELSFFVFDDEAEQKAPFSKELRRVNEAIAGLQQAKKKESESGMYGALTAAVKAFGTPHPGDAIFIITGWEGKKNDQDAVDSVLNAGIRVFGVSFDASALPGKPPGGIYSTVVSYSPIDALARATGGLWARTAGKNSVSVLARSLALPISEYYSVVLRPVQPLNKREPLKVGLRGETVAQSGEKIDLKKVSVSHPPMLFSCR